MTITSISLLTWIEVVWIPCLIGSVVTLIFVGWLLVKVLRLIR